MGVVTHAIATAALTSVPAALLLMPVLSIASSLTAGHGWAEAWQEAQLTDEDWEMFPAFLVMALMVGILAAVASASAWLVAVKRSHPRWALHLLAALAAAAVPLLCCLMLNPPLAVGGGVAAGVVALVAAPRLGYEQRAAGRGATPADRLSRSR